jgi:3-hydroxyacyl-CoA dehydrogenase
VETCPPGTPLSEQYMLHLGRGAFKSLCGERQTQERIQYHIKDRKDVRN